jgi:L-2-hydroxyglutarate oxidase
MTDRVEVADVVVIGAGILGLASAYQLLRARPGLSVLVLEKEDEIGRHQSSHNSGVLHAGLSYQPGSAKARLAVDGIRQMTEFCRTHGVEHDICGKLVVATRNEEMGRLRELMDRGCRNGLKGLAWVAGAEIRAYEPAAHGVAALWVPEEGIASYPGVCRALAGEIGDRGGKVTVGAPVRELRRERGRWVVPTVRGVFEARVLVNCAGLYADRIARRAGVRSALRIVPFRGMYYALRPERAALVRHLIYPVPDPAFPFLGVHLTRTTGGTVEAGPNAVLAFSREGYRGIAIRLRDAAELAASRGLWRFLARHPSPCWNEVRLTLSRRRFAAALRRLVPDIRESDLVPSFSGVRAQAMRPDGTLEHDFVFGSSPSAVHLLNAPSPGATAALAIGDEVMRQVLPLLPHARATGMPASAIPASGAERTA